LFYARLDPQEETEVIRASIVVYFVDLRAVVDERQHQGHRGNNPVPDALQDAGDAAMRIGRTHHRVRPGRVEPYADAGKLDLAARSRCPGSRGRRGRIDLHDCAGRTTCRHDGQQGNENKNKRFPFHFSPPHRFE